MDRFQQIAEMVTSSIANENWQQLKSVYANGNVFHHPFAKVLQLVLQDESQISGYYGLLKKLGLQVQQHCVELRNTSDPQWLVFSFKYRINTGVGTYSTAPAIWIGQVKEGKVVQSFDYLQSDIDIPVPPAEDNHSM